MSIVRDNLMTRPGYTPVLRRGELRLEMAENCIRWVSIQVQMRLAFGFEAEFVESYKKRSAQHIHEQRGHQ